MSWVEKNRKINNQGRDDYSGLKSMRIKYSCSLELIKMQTSYRNFTLKLMKERLC